MKKIIKSKRAQLAIFIILAILIVIALLVLLLFGDTIKPWISPKASQEYIKECTQTATKEALQKVEMQGGSLDPEHYLLYQSNKIDYACYTEKYYETCIMQKPFLKQNVEQEVASYIEPKIKSCFESMKEQLKRSGSEVAVQDIKAEAALSPNTVAITIRAPTTVRRQGALSFENMKVNVKSEAYDLVMLASSISNYEARYGDADTVAYMMYYPDIKVEKIERSDGRVYILTHKPSNEKFIFAVRSIAWPAGYLGVEK